MILTFDGPAASGKGSVVGHIASLYGWPVLDTGQLYRWAAERLRQAFCQHPAVKAGNFAHVSPAMRHTFVRQAADYLHRIRDSMFPPTGIGGHDEYFALWVSAIAREPLIRDVLTSAQQSYAAACANLILDGRDAGTVIAPQADVKFYLTATLDCRARRRFQQQKDNHKLDLDRKIVYDELRCILRTRDRQDVQRPLAPLMPAADAVVIDTTFLSLADTIAVVCCVLAGALP